MGSSEGGAGQGLTGSRRARERGRRQKERRQGGGGGGNRLSAFSMSGVRVPSY